MRVLFTSMSAQSHIAPMLPLARTAARAGHEVVSPQAPTPSPWCGARA